jgi:hypothetical protein
MSGFLSALFDLISPSSGTLYSPASSPLYFFGVLGGCSDGQAIADLQVPSRMRLLGGIGMALFLSASGFSRLTA